LFHVEAKTQHVGMRVSLGMQRFDVIVNETAVGRTISTPLSTVRSMTESDVDMFSIFVSGSGLPTFSAPESVGEVFRRGHVFLALCNGEIAGCTCIKRDVAKRFESDQHIKCFPIPNIFFCGTYVAPNRRGLGIGELLYRFRLKFAQTHFRAPIFVEMLGNGSPNSVHKETLKGYRFHIRNGFKEVGFSIDDDKGTILSRKMY
jgi:GNAT superfamily N-acetyltransferase